MRSSPRSIAAHGFARVPQRVARRLLLMAGGYGDANVSRRVLKVPQEDLAMMLALSRQTINQILRQFEMQGSLTLRYAEIEIVDVAMLTSLANPDTAIHHRT